MEAVDILTRRVDLSGFAEWGGPVGSFSNLRNILFKTCGVRLTNYVAGSKGLRFEGTLIVVTRSLAQPRS
jgi:hypothetical protein